MENDKYDLAIIGGGVAGFGAAMYAGRLNLKTIVIGDLLGGIITTTDVVENYPGFIRLDGEELADKIQEHALEYDIHVEEDKVEKIEKTPENTYRILTENEEIFLAKSLIFATGAKHRKLPAKGAEDFENRGVYYCALCDGPLFKGKTVAVVGGSDSSAKEALLLTGYAQKVYMVYRGDKIHPEPVNEERVNSKDKIEIILNTNVVEVMGEEKLNKVILDKEFNGSKEFPLDGLFVAIGSIPNTEIAKSLGVELNEKGEIKIDRKSQTNIDGIYAAGDVTDTEFKQAITGVAEGVHAAYRAYSYVTEEYVCLVCDDIYED